MWSCNGRCSSLRLTNFSLFLPSKLFISHSHCLLHSHGSCWQHSWPIKRLIYTFHLWTFAHSKTFGLIKMAHPLASTRPLGPPLTLLQPNFDICFNHWYKTSQFPFFVCFRSFSLIFFFIHLPNLIKANHLRCWFIPGRRFLTGHFFPLVLSIFFLCCLLFPFFFSVGYCFTRKYCELLNVYCWGWITNAVFRW